MRGRQAYCAIQTSEVLRGLVNEIWHHTRRDGAVVHQVLRHNPEDFAPPFDASREYTVPGLQRHHLALN